MIIRTLSVFAKFPNPRLFLLALSPVPLIGVLLGLLNSSHLVIYALQIIAPICISIIMLWGLKKRDVEYPQANFIFFLPYSLLSISCLKFFFDLQNPIISIAVLFSYLGNIFVYDYAVVADFENKSIFNKAIRSLTTICFNFYLLPFFIYNFKLFLEIIPVRLFILIAVSILCISLCMIELLRWNRLYKEKRYPVKGKADFLLLSNMLGWILVGIGLCLQLENWYIALPFSALANISYVAGIYKVFKRRNTTMFLVIISAILAFLTLCTTLRSETAQNMMFSLLAHYMYLGIIVYGSFFMGEYERIRVIVYIVILCEIFYIVRALPSDFLSEIPSFQGDKDAVLSFLSTVIQSFSTILAILATIITFVFAYILSSRRSNNKNDEKTGSKDTDLVLLTFILAFSLSMGYRLVNTILQSLAVIGEAQSNMQNDNIVTDIIRESQACFCILLMYLFVIGFVFFFYYISDKISLERIMMTEE